MSDTARALATQDVIESARASVAAHERRLKLENKGGSRGRGTATPCELYQADIDMYVTMCDLRSALHGLDQCDQRGSDE